MKDVKDDHMLGQIGLGAKRGFAVLNKTFTARLRKSSNRGGWTYLIWPESAAFFGTRGR